jgi:hypothetical protein
MSSHPNASTDISPSPLFVNGHPVILNRILSYCDNNTLCAWLCTSRQLLDQAGALLYQDITLRTDPAAIARTLGLTQHIPVEIETQGISTHGSESPSTPSKTKHRSVIPFIGTDISNVSKTDGFNRAGQSTFKNRLLEQCRVFRVQPRAITREIEKMKPFLPKLRTLRIPSDMLTDEIDQYWNDHSVWQPERLVLHYGIYEGERWTKLMLYPQWDGKLKEMVLYMGTDVGIYNWDVSLYLDPIPTILTASISLVTVIFGEKSGSEGWCIRSYAGSGQDGEYDPAKFPHIIAALAKWVKVNHCVLRLVNVGSFHPIWIGLDASTPSLVVAETVEDRLRAEMNDLLADDKEREKLHAKLEMLSLEGYKQKGDLEGVFPTTTMS